MTATFSHGIEKACAVPYRWNENAIEILAFHHPLAGKQFVKGSIEPNESIISAAARELLEEGGVNLETLTCIGSARIGSPTVQWHFCIFDGNGLPDAWDYKTRDDGGRVFSFFWHPLSQDLDEGWHPIFHQAFQFIRQALPPSPRPANRAGWLPAPRPA